MDTLFNKQQVCTMLTIKYMYIIQILVCYLNYCKCLQV